MHITSRSSMVQSLWTKLLRVEEKIPRAAEAELGQAVDQVMLGQRFEDQTSAQPEGGRSKFLS